MTSRFSTLRLDRVSRSFGRHTALHALDLEIAGGEFVALLGPSGCGKSTALNCLAGLLPLTGGAIHLDDRRIDGIPPEQRGFGMVFQNYALFPHLTVRGNVAFGLKMARVPKAEIARRTDRALEMVQLAGHADKRPGQLSGGQQQRVAIARAIVLEPRLVLMDEPLSNLDAALRLEMRTEIRRLHQSLGLTTVYVTHDQEEALSLADRLVVLRDGVMQQVGTPEEVYGRPANRYVAGFMGYRNMLQARVTGVRGDHRTVETGGGRLTGLDRGGLAEGGRAVAAIRPEDLEVAARDTDGGPQAEGAREEGPGTEGLPAEVEVVEYHGRELAVQGRLAGGRPVHFRTRERVAPGDRVTLTAAPERVLVFAPEDTGPAGPDATAPDATAPDGTAPEGSSSDGTPPEGAAPDGTKAGEASRHGTVTS